MLFNHIAIAAACIDTLLRVRNRHLKTAPLQAAHVDAAAALLSREFCRREPLCRLLGTKVADILPFFIEQVKHVANQGLGIVALDRDGVVRGVVTIEDEYNRFVPTGMQLDPGLEAIGAYLDEIPLPAAFVKSSGGKIFHCALAAVSSGRAYREALPLMILAVYKHLIKRGYTHGYAKISNPAIVSRFRRLEKLAKTNVFTCAARVEPAGFKFNGGYPFAGFVGETALFTWIMK